jgi:hypothetical protein
MAVARGLETNTANFTASVAVLAGVGLFIEERRPFFAGCHIVVVSLAVEPFTRLERGVLHMVGPPVRRFIVLAVL